MSEPSHPVENPARAMEKMRESMRRILTVSKEEIVRRERAANLPARNGKKDRKKAA